MTLIFKSVVAESFIRTLKNKIYKHMASISRNVYYDILDDIVNKYNNTYHKTIKMRPADVGDNSFQNLKMYLLRVIHLIGVKKF